MKKTILLSLLLLCGVFVFGQKLSSKEYILRYKHLAIREMKRTGIPASITLAQGILESGSGNSRLARNGNNHFGIKCHNWNGKHIFEHDDRRNECFRKYRNVENSFIDHSNFLTSKARYAALFSLDSKDYKGWAKGLKKAGYATAKDYAYRLIGLIERYELYRYDDSGEPSGTYQKHEEPSSFVSYKEKSPSIKSRVRCRNCVPYFIVQKGDTYAKIKKELGLKARKIAKYNDFKKNKPLVVGEPIYLKKKKRKTPSKYRVHIANGVETMHDISQRYAVRLKVLVKNNGIESSEIPYEGQHILLR